jgi:hypothetical protein
MPTSPQIVCVVIPCYRTELTTSEHIALTRCLTILRNHHIIVAKPMSLDLSGLARQYSLLSIESFPDENFRDVSTYNRMLLNDAFYARFAQFEYALIYQLDAFVFSDRLLEWCKLGYDYMGAPWLPSRSPPSRMRLVRAAVRRKLYRLLNRKDRSGAGLHHAQYDFCSGNGGFSLRRITAMRQVLHDLPARLRPYLEYGHYSHGEDIFFSVEANRYRTRITTPPLTQAVQFAWESHPDTAAVLNGNNLPFGCHGWDKLHRASWRPIFAQLGYDLDTLLPADDQATKTELQP